MICRIGDRREVSTVFLIKTPLFFINDNTIKPTMICSSESWKKHEARINFMEVRVLRRIENKLRKDEIRTKTFRR